MRCDISGDDEALEFPLTILVPKCLLQIADRNGKMKTNGGGFPKRSLLISSKTLLFFVFYRVKL